MNFDAQDDFVVRPRRRNEPDFWHRLNRVVQALVILVFLFIVGIMFYPVWNKQQQMRQSLVALEHEHAEKTAILSDNKRRLNLLRTDSDYVETIARDLLNLMKPDETVFRVELPQTLGTHVQP